MEPIILIDEDDDEGFLSEIAVAKPKINQNPKTSPNQPNWNSGKPNSTITPWKGIGMVSSACKRLTQRPSLCVKVAVLGREDGPRCERTDERNWRVCWEFGDAAACGDTD
ncbi:hypothetical protein ACFE04_026171 [Oxalis oulophora]